MIEPELSAGRQISEAEVMRRAHRALNEACAYFGISSDWRFTLLSGSSLGEGNFAQVELDQTYLRATIELSVLDAQRDPGHLWQSIGHEVAHVVTAEWANLWRRLPEEVRNGPLDPYHSDACERATVRLERMFLRDVPEPDWEQP